MIRRAPLGVLAAVLLMDGVAGAAFKGSPATSSLTASTLTVAAVTNLSATPSCGPTLSLTAKVVLTWTGTTTSSATSYEIRRRIAPAVATAIGTAAIGTTTYADSGLTTNTTYRYVVRTYRGSWFTDSAEVAATTPIVCL